MAKRWESQQFQFQFDDIHKFLQSLFNHSLYVKRVDSLANATWGVMISAAFGIRAKEVFCVV